MLSGSDSLFNPEHELSAGYATIEFDVPDELVFLSDYGDWNDHLAEGDATLRACCG